MQANNSLQSLQSLHEVLHYPLYSRYHRGCFGAPLDGLQQLPFHHLVSFTLTVLGSLVAYVAGFTGQLYVYADS